MRTSIWLLAGFLLLMVVVACETGNDRVEQAELRGYVHFLVIDQWNEGTVLASKTLPSYHDGVFTLTNALCVNAGKTNQGLWVCRHGIIYTSISVAVGEGKYTLTSMYPEKD